jgi:Ufm1-specific protease 2
VFHACFHPIRCLIYLIAADLEALLPSPLTVVGTFKAGNDNDESLETVPNPLQERCTLIRCALDYTLEVASEDNEAVAAQLNDLTARLQSPQLAFLMDSAASAAPVLANDQRIETLGGSWEAPVQFMPVLRASSHFSRESSSSPAMTGPRAPLLTVQPGTTKVQWSALRLDALAYVPHGTPAHVAAREYALPSLWKQLETAKKTLLARKFPHQGNGRLPPLRSLHFCPLEFGHHITVMYPLPSPCIEDQEAALLEDRTALHRLLGLPLDRPLLRSANALQFGSLSTLSIFDKFATGGKRQQNSEKNGINKVKKGATSSAATRLSNVHLGLAPSGLTGGSLHLVQGDYDYYHYMQDKFDDSGWGCAYRSLQTIASWFLRQHYTTRAPPSHAEIQSTLVMLGDKGREFVGSRQWIGAIELGYVLDSLFGVQSKVLTVSNGSEMPSKAREIAAHFDTQGEGLI